MIKKSRADGTLIRDLPHFVRIMPYVMPTRASASIFLDFQIDLTHTLAFLGKYNRSLAPGTRRLSLFQLVMCAALRTVALRPRLNRFVSGRNYYQRNRIVFNFIAKRELNDDGEEINVTFPLALEDTLPSFAEKVNRALAETLQGKGTAADRTNEWLVRFPRWFIRAFLWMVRGLDYHNLLPRSVVDTAPFFSTIFFTNVGSVGVDAPFHHNFEIGNCGMLVALGKPRRERVVDDDGTIRARDLVRLTVTFDDRVCDGQYSGRSLALFKHFVENPEELTAPPAIDAALLAEHRLRGAPD